jgi:hypothetical protein
MNTNLPKRMAFIGLCLGLFSVGIFFYIRIVNPFALPSLSNSDQFQNYTAPRMYFVLNKLIFLICPGQFIQLFFIGSTGCLAWFVWLAGVIVNGIIFYGIGFVFTFLSQIFKK